jgi:alanyl-tRNA synthetase
MQTRGPARALGGVRSPARRQDGKFPSRRRLLDDRSRPRGVGAESARAEAEANRVVWEDRPVAILFAAADEIATLALRKEPKREGTLRLIDVEDFDLSACGGTHVARTGAIGIIAVAATERFRGGSRVTFLCGGRALTGFRALRDAVAGSVRALSVLPAELPAAIERLQADGKELRKQIKDFQSKLAAQEAARSRTAPSRRGGTPRSRVASRLGCRGIEAHRHARIVERPGHVAVLLGDPAPAAVVVARAADVGIDAGAAEATRGTPRWKRGRQAGDGAGRRHHVASHRCAAIRARARFLKPKA